MLTYLNSKRKSKILLVAVMIIALVVTYAVPISTYADVGPTRDNIELETVLDWVGVPTGVVVPSVTLQLVRKNIEDEEYVPFGEEVTLPVGTTTHTYSVDPGNPAFTYDLRLVNYNDFSNDYVFEVIPDEQGFKITLTYSVKTKVDLLGELIWTGGKPFDAVGFVKPGAFSVQLYRNGQPLTSVIIAQAIMMETSTGWEAEYLFKDLDRFDVNKQEYIYTINSGTAPRYEKTASDMKITYNLIPVLKTIKITKIWIGGPSEKPSATINLSLRQSSTGRETLPVVFDNPSPADPLNGVDTWIESKLVTIDTARFSSFSATAKEVAVLNYKTVSPIGGNWVNGFVVTNIYRSDIIATKVWDGGPAAKPEVTFKLIRQAGNGPKITVPGSKVIKPESTEAVWMGSGTEVTNDAGVPYRYWVEETTVLKNYSKVENGLTVTNTYVSPKTTVTGIKAWINGPAIKPAIKLQLNRDGEPLGGPIDLPNGILTYDWTNLDLTDNDGVAYIYTVDEVAVPDNYIKSLNGLTVTNAYVSPKKDVTVEKIWEFGPENHPDIELQLYQNDKELFEPVTLVNGDTEFTWNVDVTDEFGKPFEYSVEEIGTLDNYRTTYSNLNNGNLAVINTYEIPTIDVVGYKQWVGGPEVRPTVVFQLVRNNIDVICDEQPNGNVEPMMEAMVSYESPCGTREIVDGQNSATWYNLPETDIDGNVYKYTVREVTIPSNYEMTLSEDGLTITNTYKKPSSGGGGGGKTTIIPEEEVPLALITDHIAYIQGYPENAVRPEGNVTREEVAAVFFRLLESTYKESIRTTSSDFNDVGSARWSTKHIGTLVNGTIIKGYPDGTFKPGNFITRAELATIASRFDDLRSTTGGIFTDIDGHWAKENINSSSQKGWVNGYPDGTFKPDQYITRAEFVTLVNNVLQRRVHTENILPEARQFPDLVKGKWYYEAMEESINSHLYERLEDTYEKWIEINSPIIEM